MYLLLLLPMDWFVLAVDFQTSIAVFNTSDHSLYSLSDSVTAAT